MGLIDWLIDLLIDWLIYLFIDLLIDWFIYLFIYFGSKEAYPIVRQLEKNNSEKSKSESYKMREKQILGP